jgi:hypothetical protein
MQGEEEEEEEGTNHTVTQRVRQSVGGQGKQGAVHTVLRGTNYFVDSSYVRMCVAVWVCVCVVQGGGGSSPVWCVRLCVGKRHRRPHHPRRRGGGRERGGGGYEAAFHNLI